MRGIWMPVLAMCLLLTGCGGLPQPREMGDVALLRTMGVDWQGGQLKMTVSTGPRAKGVQAEGQDALVLSAQNSTLSGAALDLRGQSDSAISFGHVDQLLLGEELVCSGANEVLDYFARDRDLGLGVQIWAVRGDSAGAAVESGGGQGVESRLSTLQTDGELGFGSIPRTAGQVYSELLERGSSYVPALGLSGEENSRLEERGYAILKEGRLAGYLEGDSARGLELLAGRAAAEVLEIPLTNQKVTVQVTRAATVSRFASQDSTLSLSCRVWAQLAECSWPPTEEELHQLQHEVARRQEEKIRLALSQLMLWRADCLGLGHKAGVLSPGRWSALAENWPEHFGAQSPQINLTVELTR